MNKVHKQVLALGVACCLLLSGPAGSRAQGIGGMPIPLLAVNARLSEDSPKLFSTNVTLIALSNVQEPVTRGLQYFRPDGTTWPAGPAYTTVTLQPNRGLVLRQYDDPAMPAGLGSGSIALGAGSPSAIVLPGVVQLIARNGQVASSGAYGTPSMAPRIFVPLVARRLNSASGRATSQLTIQNPSTDTATVSVVFTPAPGSAGQGYTRTGISIPPQSSYFYDLATETNLPEGFIGSATIEGATTAVIANLFAGPHQLQTVSGFREREFDELDPDIGFIYFVPLFMSRLANGNNTSISVQNLGTEVPANGMEMSCNAAGGSQPGSFTIRNPQPVPSRAAWFINPVVDLSLPGNWYGACTILAGGIRAQAAVLVQQRQPGVNDNSAAYQAISTLDRGLSTQGTSTLSFPLVAKRLPNGFATAVSIMNISQRTAQVTLRYLPEGGGSAIVVGPFTVPSRTVLIRNHRLVEGPQAETALPDGWVGSLQVVADYALGGYVQLTNLLPLPGDTLMTYELDYDW